MSYEYFSLFKSIHLISIVAWFAGLFYLVRLFVYHAESLRDDGQKGPILCSQFALMERRLYFGITWPAAILSLISGLTLLSYFWPIARQFWIHLKLSLVLLLFIYRLWCGHMRKQLLSKGRSYKSSDFFRYWNEVATLFLVSIVFTVVYKDLNALFKGLGYFVAFVFLMFLSILIYKQRRLKQIEKN